jgi:hypothetical protein
LGFVKGFVPRSIIDKIKKYMLISMPATSSLRGLRMSNDKITEEDFEKMTTREKAKRYAEDVLKTEKEVKKDNFSGKFYRYNFLMGNGSLGYPMGRPSDLGKAVQRISKNLGLFVGWNMENSYADFSGKITKEMVEQESYPIWEDYDKRSK